MPNTSMYTSDFPFYLYSVILEADFKSKNSLTCGCFLNIVVGHFVEISSLSVSLTSIAFRASRTTQLIALHFIMVSIVKDTASTGTSSIALNQPVAS